MPTRKNFPSYKLRRKEGADKRAAERAKLSPAQKLERAIGAKEKAKYAKQVEEANKKPAKKERTGEQELQPREK